MKINFTTLLLLVLVVGAFEAMANPPSTTQPSDLYRKIEAAFNASKTPPNMARFQVKKIDQENAYPNCLAETFEGQRHQVPSILAIEGKFTQKTGNGPLDPPIVIQKLFLLNHDPKLESLRSFFTRDGISFENGVALLDKSAQFSSIRHSPEHVEECDDDTNSYELLVNSFVGLNSSKTALVLKNACNNGKVLGTAEFKEAPGMLLGRISSPSSVVGQPDPFFYYYCWKDDENRL